MTGKIIHLNGTSSSGKSSIVRHLQETLKGNFLHTGIDHFLGNLHEKFVVASKGKNLQSAEGFLALFSENDGRIQKFIPGPTGLRILKTSYEVYATLAKGGIDIIIDDVFIEPVMVRQAVRLLAPFTVLSVGIRCSLEEIERREHARGDRLPGIARAYHQIVHDLAFNTYDLEVDTSKHSSRECADIIRKRFEAGGETNAFRTIAKTLAQSGARGRAQ